MAKRVSIYDIAQLAGVSAATVSNVLNEKGSYSAKTRELVLGLARREGYVANFAAKSLRESSTRTIGIITPDVSNDFFSTLVLAVEGGLREAGYSSYICNTGNEADLETSYLRDLLHRQADGIVFIGGMTHAPIDAGVDIPAVHIDHMGASGLAREVFVENDMRALSFEMTSTLAGYGCERIALASVSASFYRTEEHSQASGYYAFLAEHGIALDRNLILEGRHLQTSMIEAAELVTACLDAGYALDGVVALGDRVALGVVNALKERGLAVGRDVRVIGMDNSIYSRISSPAISTVDRHTGEMAERGVEALLAMLGGEVPAQTRVVIGHDLIERTTTTGE